MNDLIDRHGVAAWLENIGYKKLANYIMDKNRFPSEQSDFDTVAKIDKAHDDGYKQGYLQGKADYEPKIGKWKMMQSLYGFGLLPVCSECEYVPSNREKYKFCPNCGTYMRQGEDDNV